MPNPENNFFREEESGKRVVNHTQEGYDAFMARMEKIDPGFQAKMREKQAKVFNGKLHS